MQRLRLASSAWCIVAIVVWFSCLTPATFAMRLVETHVADAQSLTPFRTELELTDGITIDVRSVVDNGRGQPFNMLHLILSDMESDPPLLSMATMRYTENDGSHRLAGLGSYSVLVEDVEVTVKGFPGGPAAFTLEPIAELLPFDDLLTDEALADIEAHLNAESLINSAQGRLAQVALHPGNLNSDRHVSIEDIITLSNAINSGEMQSRFDLDQSGELNSTDLAFLTRELLGIPIGDANLDGVFNSSDLTKVFQSGEYQDFTLDNSDWSEGDWTGDLDFNSNDLVAAFQDGRYEVAGSTATVPEPTAAGLLVTGLLIGISHRRHLFAAEYRH